MFKVLPIIILLAFVFSACSAPLDASKVKTNKMEIDGSDKDPIHITVPIGSKEFIGSEPEDMLGMFTLYSKKIRTQDFALEIEFTTIPNMSVKEVLEEKGGGVKSESNFNRVIEEIEDGFLYESKEINGDLNYSFIKAIVTDSKYAVVFPEPKADGNTSLEEAKYMFEILNKK